MITVDNLWRDSVDYYIIIFMLCQFLLFVKVFFDSFGLILLIYSCIMVICKMLLRWYIGYGIAI